MKDSDQPYKFTDIWAVANALVTAPVPDTAAGGNASQQQGFPPITAVLPGAGGIPPNISDFNGVLQYLSLWARWFQAGAPRNYDAAFSASIGGYPYGATLISASGTHNWISLVDDNTSDPDTGGANWLNTASSWHDVSGSRILGTTYTNATKKTMTVCASVAAGVGSTSAIFIVNGVTVATIALASAIGTVLTVPVPADATYAVGVGGGAINSWFEFY